MSVGRAEKRVLERKNRLERNKNSVKIDKYDLAKLKKDISKTVSEYSTEALMTCFALAEHNLWGFGCEKIMESLEYIDDLMGYILTDETSIEELKQQLFAETGIQIRA